MPQAFAADFFHVIFLKTASVFENSSSEIAIIVYIKAELSEVVRNYILFLRS